jgi:hypothetical protein
MGAPGSSPGKSGRDHKVKLCEGQSRAVKCTGKECPPAAREIRTNRDPGYCVTTRYWTEHSRSSHHGRYWQFEHIVVKPPAAQERDGNNLQTSLCLVQSG